MGMSDTQFKAYIRSLYDQLEEANEIKDEEAKTKKIAKILAQLRAALED